MEKSHEGVDSVRECMTNPVFTIEAKAPLREAWAIMTRRKIRHLPVVNGKTIQGILSDRDLYRALPSYKEISNVEVLKKALDTTTVSDVMTKNVSTVDQDDSLHIVARKMLDKKVSCLPVMNGGGLVGIISAHDLIRHMASNGHFGKVREELKGKME